MFGKAYKLPFRLMGIPLFVDITFLFVLPLFTWIIGHGIKENRDMFGLDAEASRLRMGILPYVLGFIAVLGLFISVVLHELGHAVTARGYGVQTRNITLWLLGGVARLESIPRQRGAEAIIAIVGPAISALLAGLFYLISIIMPEHWYAIQFLFKYLAGTNLVIAVFNLLPALPLDGGRILRSLLALKLDYLTATRAAAGISKVLAVGLGLWGLLSGQVMFMLIAFFVYMAASTEMRQLVLEEMLEGMLVRDLMNRNVVTVSPSTSVAELTQIMIRERHKGFPVIDESGNLVGMVDLERLQGATPVTLVGQIMSPSVGTIEEIAPAIQALTRMSENDTDRLVAMNETGQMSGIITRADLIRAIQVRLTAARSRHDTMLRPQRLAHT